MWHVLIWHWVQVASIMWTYKQHTYCELVYFVGDAVMTVESKVNWPLIGQFSIGITRRVKTVQVVSYVKSQATEARRNNGCISSGSLHTSDCCCSLHSTQADQCTEHWSLHNALGCSGNAQCTRHSAHFIHWFQLGAVALSGFPSLT